MQLKYLVLLFCLATLCGGVAQAQHAPALPDAPWVTSAKLPRTDVGVVGLHETRLDKNDVYSLGDLIDIAESNNPSTRAAWTRARTAAENVGIAKSELYPTVIATATGRTFLNPPLLYQSFAVQNLGLFEAALHLDYTLVDFGARRSEITASQARLLAANFSFNNETLVLIQQVSQRYYDLLDATGLRRAAEVSLREAKAFEDAAEDRKRNGLATLPDVLEARAATARANYNLQKAIGVEQTSFGNLATVMTASPIDPFKVQSLDALQIPAAMSSSVEDAIHNAYRDRPDLLADIARVRADRAEITHARTAFYPALSFQGERGWLRAWGQQENYPGTYAQTRTYDAQLNLRWTVFDGFKRFDRLKRAETEEATATEEVHEREDTIAAQVWGDYADAVTALQQHNASTALLSATQESYSAALESYKSGVRNILDVLSAEDQLAQARAIDVTARARVLESFTTLAFQTGALLTQHPQGHHP